MHSLQTKTALHPCFDKEAEGKYARLHLPVAPRCNIQCRYCDRKSDCANENKPGHASRVLSPTQALRYLEHAVKHEPRLSVVGIAGPGDAFANAEATLETLRLAHDRFPHLVFCLSTNGLEAEPYVPALKELGVDHVTVTVNAADPAIAEKIYAWVRPGRRTLRGREAAEVLIERQFASIAALKKAGMVVKVNSVVLPGINDHHIPELAGILAGMGADTMNPIPVAPSPTEFFADMKEPDTMTMARIHHAIQQHLPVMTHCKRCRADAAGMLGQDDPQLRTLLETAADTLDYDTSRPYVAFASREGLLVNHHLGEAEHVFVCEPSGNGMRTIDIRATPPRGLGDLRWEMLADSLSDCRALLVSGVGESPLRVLEAKGIRVLEVEGLAEEAAIEVFAGRAPREHKARDQFRCGDSCGGNGQGCG